MFNGVFSTRSSFLIAIGSAILGCTLITAKYRANDKVKQYAYQTGTNNYAYANYDNNAVQRRGYNGYKNVDWNFGYILKVLKRMANGFGRITDRQGRQDDAFGQIFSSRIWTVAASALGFVGVFREEIADLFTTTTTTTTPATTDYDPCANINCASGLTCSLGICKCGSTSSGTTFNRCVSGVPKCGTSSKCSGTTPICLTSSQATPSSTSTTATCQCNTGSTDCRTSSSTTTPYCCDGTNPVGDACTSVGSCEACKGKAGTSFPFTVDLTATGNNQIKGTCPTTGQKCQSDGSCT